MVIRDLASILVSNTLPAFFRKGAQSQCRGFSLFLGKNVDLLEDRHGDEIKE